MSGEAKLRRSSAVFAGAVRNCGLYLPAVLENLDRFSAFFLDVRFVFAVSDTTDDSVAIIRGWLGRGKSGAVLELGSSAMILTDARNGSHALAMPAWTTFGTHLPRAMIIWSCVIWTMS